MNRKKKKERNNYCGYNDTETDSDNIVPTFECTANLLVTASHDQYIIGWGSFLRGRLSNCFSKLVYNYYPDDKLGRHFISQKWS